MKKISKRHLLRFLINPLLLALPMTLIVVYFLSGFFSKYTIEQPEIKPFSIEDAVFLYNDLDGNGNSDEVYFFTNTQGNATAYAKLDQGAILGQWNMNGVFLSMKSCGLVDVDQDGKAEIVMLYFRNDSAFLSVFNPLNPENLFRSGIFIDTLRFRNAPNDFFFSNFHIQDLNDDTHPEIIFSISAGFNLYPRKLYAYDLHNDTVIRSTYLANQIDMPSDLVFSDLDNDGTLEIVVGNFAPGNMKSFDKSSLHDHSSWLIILDHKLQIYAPPVEFKATPSYVFSHIIHSEGKTMVLSFFNNTSSNEQPSSISLYDPIQKIIIRQVFLDGYYHLRLIESKCSASNAVVYNHKGEVFSIGSDLQLKQIGNLNKKTTQVILAEIDVDGCGEKELILQDKEYKGFYVIRNDLTNPVFLSIPGEPANQFFKAIELRRNYQTYGLALQIEDNSYKISYKKNRLHMLRWTVYLSIFILLATTYQLSLTYFRNQLKKDYEKDKLIAELKLKSIRNQLDPHFTFNALNTIASALYKEDNKTAYTYFAKFSKLMRTSMLYSDKIVRLLNEEIDFTLQYLEIEKFRFRNKFNYEFDVDQDVDLTCEVPRMIIQTYADSAIANGLMHRVDGGMLLIAIKEHADHLEIRVTDNGVGIEKSKEYNKEKAFKSAKLMDEFIDLINGMNTSKISVKMYDLKENDVVAGTEVLIVIPFDLKYKLS